MKSKKVLTLVLTFSILLVFSVSALGLAGGMPAAHGKTGEEFGNLVSTIAQTGPAALVEHVAEKPEMPNINAEKPVVNDDKSEIVETDKSEKAGGMPAAHGLTGKEFGMAVSDLAQTEPGAVAAHVAKKPDVSDMNDDKTEMVETDKSEKAGGMPAAHGVNGKDFGAAVSGLAQSEPGAVAEHVAKKPDVSDMNDDKSEDLDVDESSMAGGVPAAHGSAGEDFGEDVSDLAQSEPAALVEHVRSK